MDGVVEVELSSDHAMYIHRDDQGIKTLAVFDRQFITGPRPGRSDLVGSCLLAGAREGVDLLSRVPAHRAEADEGRLRSGAVRERNHLTVQRLDRVASRRGRQQHTRRALKTAKGASDSSSAPLVPSRWRRAA
jgi:hypothetical protein